MKKGNSRGTETCLFCSSAICSPQWPFLLGKLHPPQDPLQDTAVGALTAKTLRSLVSTLCFWAPATSQGIICINLASALGPLPRILEAGERAEPAGSGESSQVPFQGRKASPATGRPETTRKVYHGTGLSHTNGQEGSLLMLV